MTNHPIRRNIEYHIPGPGEPLPDAVPSAASHYAASRRFFDFTASDNITNPPTNDNNLNTIPSVHHQDTAPNDLPTGTLNAPFNNPGPAAGTDTGTEAQTQTEIEIPPTVPTIIPPDTTVIAPMNHPRASAGSNTVTTPLTVEDIQDILIRPLLIRFDLQHQQHHFRLDQMMHHLRGELEMEHVRDKLSRETGVLLKEQDVRAMILRNQGQMELWQLKVKFMTRVGWVVLGVLVVLVGIWVWGLGKGIGCV